MVQTKRKPRLLTVLVLALAVLVGTGHILATLVFTGPSNPIKSSLQPQINRYFLGPLDQGWNLFAPGPYSQDEYLLIRGCTSPIDVCANGSDAGAQFTAWRNVTADEMEDTTGNIFANRHARQSKALVGRVWGAMNDLTDLQQDQVAQPAVLGDSPFDVDAYSDEPSESLSASELSNLRLYQRLEDAVVGFASLYAQEQWGGASMVEIRLVREAVPPFDQRHNPSDTRSQTTKYIGWRDSKNFEKDTMDAWK